MADSRRTVLPDPRKFPRFAGIATFCRFPQICHVAPAQQPVDWAIYGIPFDGGVSYRSGARFGPRAIREQSQYVKPYHMVHDVDVTEVLSLADGGDAPVSPYSCEATVETAAEFAAKLGTPGRTRLLAVGGDHSIGLANLRATRAARDVPPALIHFDTHTDTMDSLWGEKYGHASVFARAAEEGLIDPERMISIGIKGPLNGRSDRDVAREQAGRIVTYDRWRREGDGAIRAFVEGLGGAEAYISFDIDVVDPAYAPGTGTPCMGGFTAAETFDLLRSLAGLNIVGADVVEVLPDRDPAGVTAFLAAHIVFEIIALDAVRRARSGGAGGAAAGGVVTSAPAGAGEGGRARGAGAAKGGKKRER